MYHLFRSLKTRPISFTVKDKPLNFAMILEKGAVISHPALEYQKHWKDGSRKAMLPIEFLCQCKMSGVHIAAK